MSGSHRILIVEDEPNARLVLRTALVSNDYSVSTAPDGETALTWLGQERFDLVLLDLRMPGVGGLEVLGRLREQGNDVPVVIVSAHDRAPHVVRSMKLGATDFLVKPLTPDALRRAVAEVLSKAGKWGKGAGGGGGEGKPLSVSRGR
jgi:DNA-binding response OmpR family regulator